MIRKPGHFKTVLTAVMVRLSLLLLVTTVLTSAAFAGDVSVEAVSGQEWKIINPDGEVVGLLRSETRKSFTFYDAGGSFVGTILESKAWMHRLYRKRTTQVTPEEARLYLDALKAIEAIR